MSSCVSWSRFLPPCPPAVKDAPSSDENPYSSPPQTASCNSDTKTDEQPCACCDNGSPAHPDSERGSRRAEMDMGTSSYLKGRKLINVVSRGAIYANERTYPCYERLSNELNGPIGRDSLRRSKDKGIFARVCGRADAPRHRQPGSHCTSIQGTCI